MNSSIKSISHFFSKFNPFKNETGRYIVKKYELGLIRIAITSFDIFIWYSMNMQNISWKLEHLKFGSAKVEIKIKSFESASNPLITAHIIAIHWIPSL